MDDVRTYLSGQDKNALVEMLVDRAMKDERLRQSLFIKAAKKSPKKLDLATYRRAIDDAAEPDGFIDYRSAYDYAHGIEEAIDSVEELLKEGHPAEVIELAEHAPGWDPERPGQIVQDLFRAGLAGLRDRPEHQIDG